jgi:hypothetical protein
MLQFIPAGAAPVVARERCGERNGGETGTRQATTNESTMSITDGADTAIGSAYANNQQTIGPILTAFLAAFLAALHKRAALLPTLQRTATWATTF